MKSKFLIWEKLVFRISRPECDYYCVSRGVFFCLIRRTTSQNIIWKWRNEKYIFQTDPALNILFRDDVFVTKKPFSAIYKKKFTRGVKREIFRLILILAPKFIHFSYL